jgi:hypothetical protein
MSLRIFHVVFITVSIALSVFVTGWGVREFLVSRSAGALALAIVFLLAGIVLMFYANHTFRKLRDL